MATNVLSYSLLLYFSMGCCHLTEGQRKCAFGSSTVPLVMAIICYTIVMGVGWGVFAIQETPGEPLILAGAVVSTIPVLSLVSYLCFAFTFCKEHKDNSYIRFGIITIHLCAGLVQMIGAALFIAAGANPVSLSAFFLGVPAGVFGMIAGSCFIYSQCCCFVYMCGDPDVTYSCFNSAHT